MAEEDGQSVDATEAVVAEPAATDPEQEAQVPSPSEKVSSDEVPTIREDQVQTAVSFLSHPKVKGSPIKFRRSFLEKKGLTSEEIDEAFRRVPDAPTSKAATTPSVPQPTGTDSSQRIGRAPPPPPPVAVTGSLPAGLGQESSQLQSSPKPPAPLVGLQNAAVASYLTPGGQPLQLVLAPPQQVPSPPPPMRWTQMILAVAVLGAAGAGAAVVGQNMLFPRFQAWLRRVVLGSVDGEEGGTSSIEQGATARRKSGPAEEAALAAASAASSAASAATAMASAVQELIKAQAEDQRRSEARMREMQAEWKEALATATRNGGQETGLTVADLRKELRAFVAISSDLFGQPRSEQDDAQLSKLDSRSQPNGRLQKEGSLSFPRLTMGQSEGPIEQTLGDVQTHSLAVPEARPASQASVHKEPGEKGLPEQTSSTVAPSHTQAPHSASYMQVMEMLQRGERPPNIRDVNDKPPNPHQPPSEPQLAPRLKPWERSGHPTQDIQSTIMVSSSQPPPATSSSSSADGAGAAAAQPWWYKRPAAQDPPGAGGISTGRSPFPLGPSAESGRVGLPTTYTNTNPSAESGRVGLPTTYTNTNPSAATAAAATASPAVPFSPTPTTVHRGDSGTYPSILAGSSDSHSQQSNTVVGSGVDAVRAAASPPSFAANGQEPSPSGQTAIGLASPAPGPVSGGGPVAAAPQSSMSTPSDDMDADRAETEVVKEGSLGTRTVPAGTQGRATLWVPPPVPSTVLAEALPAMGYKTAAASSSSSSSGAGSSSKAAADSEQEQQQGSERTHGADTYQEEESAADVPFEAESASEMTTSKQDMMQDHTSEARGAVSDQVPGPIVQNVESV